MSNKSYPWDFKSLYIVFVSSSNCIGYNTSILVLEHTDKSNFWLCPGAYTSYWILFSFDFKFIFSNLNIIKSVSSGKLFSWIKISAQSPKLIIDKFKSFGISPFNTSNWFFVVVNWKYKSFFILTPALCPPFGYVSITSFFNFSYTSVLESLVKSHLSTTKRV